MTMIGETNTVFTSHSQRSPGHWRSRWLCYPARNRSSSDMLKLYPILPCSQETLSGRYGVVLRKRVDYAGGPILEIS